MKAEGWIGHRTESWLQKLREFVKGDEELFERLA